MAETSPLTKTAPLPAYRIVSDCIGTPRSPKCAIETYLACFERRDPQLCAIVDVPDEPARVELGLRLIGLAIPKSYSIDYFSKADSDHPQRPRFIWVVRERYCIEKGDACVALGWHDVFYMFYPVSIGKRLVLMRRWVGAPTTSFPTSIKRVDVRQTAEITACARPNAPVDCVLVLTIGCHDQGYCRDFRNGMFYTNELLARPNEYTEYRVLQQKWPHWGIIYEVRHCSRDAADCAGRDWLPKVANYGRGDDGILIVRQMDVPALGGFGASE